LQNPHRLYLVPHPDPSDEAAVDEGSKGARAACDEADDLDEEAIDLVDLSLAGNDKVFEHGDDGLVSPGFTLLVPFTLGDPITDYDDDEHISVSFSRVPIVTC
jgi:hypothetical protein